MPNSPIVTYQPEHLCNDGEFEYYVGIGESTKSKRVVTARVDLFKSIHKDAKIRVQKIISIIEIIDYPFSD